MDGNLIEVFKSGMEAAQKLNILQGDISLCCRGVKNSINGYRFRFFEDEDEEKIETTKIRKGYVIENFSEPYKIESVRTTRASRGEHVVQERVVTINSKNKILATTKIKVIQILIL
jgi:hypothetical protein